MNTYKEQLFSSHHNLIAWLSVCLALFFWLLDAYVDSYLTTDSNSYLNAVFPSEEPIVLWMRALVCFLIIFVGLLAQREITKRNRIEQELIDQINERVKIQLLLEGSEHAIHKLYKIATTTRQTYDERVNELLKMGCEYFNLEVGILSHIMGDNYEVVFAITPDNSISNGTIFPLGKTYCSTTIKEEKPVYFEHAGESEWQTHPCYDEFQLESYIGTRVMVEGEVYGTLNFSSPKPRSQIYARFDVDFLRLMADLIGRELERIKNEEQLQRLANFDYLTNVPNRRLLMMHIDSCITRARKLNKKFALLFIDLNDFKIVNDTFGHDAGDELLKTIASRLKESMRGTDMVARIGGDEFMVVLEEISDSNDARVISEKIKATVNEPITLNNRLATMSISVGVSIFPDDAVSVDEMMKVADKSMYAEKYHGGATAN